MTDLKEYKLGDLAEITSSKRIFYSDYVSQGIPFYRSKEIIERSLGEESGEPLFISQERYSEIKEAFGAPVDGDLLISAVGERAGIPYVVRNQGDFYFKDGNLIWFKNIKPELNSLFLNYWIKSSVGQETLNGIMIGSAQKALTIVGLKHLTIQLPTPQYQKLVSETLSCLDEKIDLLNRQNKTLEALAETLFRQWFVEEEEEEGWPARKIDDVISVKGGSTPSTAQPEYWNGNINWTSPKDLSNATSLFLFDTERKITEKGLTQIGSGLLPIGTLLLSSRAPIGYLAITEIEVAINQGYIAIICDKSVSNYFMYLWCKTNMDTIESAGNGSVFQEISKSSFKNLDITIPPDDKLKYFESEVTSLFQKLKSNTIQIKTLTQLRDILLPKLMSGEVKIDGVRL